MLLARRKAAWEHTAWLCHVVFNANPFREGPAVTPAQCNPLLPDSETSAVTHGIDCTDASQVSAYYDALKIRESRGSK